MHPSTNLIAICRRFAARALLCFGVFTLLTGCPKRQPRPEAEVKPTPQSAQVSPAQFGAAPAKITYASPQYKFVVIDFSSRALPPIGTTLQVTRDGQRIGAVRLSEERRTHFVTADILEGELRPGDEAH